MHYLADQTTALHEEHMAYYVEHLRTYQIPKSGLSDHPTLLNSQHLASNFGGKTLVIGHRGGKFGPDNSMETFRAAVENQLEGIEFDVSWLPRVCVSM